MDKSLHIASSQIVISFRRNSEIRKRIFEFEEKLNTEFKIPFKTISVPDDFDPNVPRFESQSISGHSRLQVSQTRITFATSYSNEYRFDSEKIASYIEKKVNLLTDLAKNEQIEFIAYVIEIGYFPSNISSNQFIKTNTGAFAINESCRDFTLLYSKEHKNSFYLNINCSKFIDQEFILNSQNLTPTANPITRQGISAVLDINTKLFFEKNLVFDIQLYEDIKKEIFEIINTKKIEDYLRGSI